MPEKQRFKAVANREREFEKLYLESYELVYNYVRYRMAGDDAAEDVVAEAYLRAAKAFDSFDPARSKFSTWVIAIATNCMSNYYRKARPAVALNDAPLATMAVEGGQAEVENRDLVTRLLKSLDDESRTLVFMKYYEGKRNIDIAAELGMNASTVATKLATALAKMRANA